MAKIVKRVDRLFLLSVKTGAAASKLVHIGAEMNNNNIPMVFTSLR